MSVFASRYGLHNRVTIAGQGEGGYDGRLKVPEIVVNQHISNQFYATPLF
jgi:hypothetical protein